MAPQTRVRTYREFLTPALHRRFVHAAILVTGLCYVEALIFGHHLPFVWLLFTSLIRAALLFVPALVVFLLRISQIEFGARVTASPFDTFVKSLIQWRTYQTVACYLFSAWVFTEVYVWSAPSHADLGLIAQGKIYERRRLNERVIYLRSHAFIAALVQSVIHICYDYSHVPLPVPRSMPISQPRGAHQGQNTKDDEIAPQGSESRSPMQQFKQFAPRMLTLPIRAFAASFASLVIYIFIRHQAWGWSLFLARIVWSIPENSMPSAIPPYHYSLLLRSWLSALLMFVLWEALNALFTAHVAQAPLKKGRPLTSYSKDPNASLLTGLNARKAAVKTFALWELYIITGRFEERRRSIFQEFDRTGGSTWQQVLTVALDMIAAADTRITEFQSPTTQSAQHLQAQNTVHHLPRLASPLKQDQVTRAAPAPASKMEQFGSSLGSAARSFGQAPPQSRVALSPQVQRYLTTARDKLLTPEQQEVVNPDTLASSFREHLVRLLRARPVDQLQPGLIFQKKFARRLRAAVLGSPRSELNPLVYAIQSITNLALASLKDDQFGTAQKDIPLMFRTFTGAISSIENIIDTAPVHWTDVNFREGDRQKIPDVDLVLRHLKSSLGRLVQAFEGFAADLGIGPGDMRQARRAAGLRV